MVMEIRFSKFNSPFSEPSEPNVHYISLNDQFDMKAGRFDAHVRLYNSLPSFRTIDVHNSLTGEHLTFEIKESVFNSYAKESKYIDSLDFDHLEELAYKNKIKAAKKRYFKLTSFDTDVVQPISTNYKNTPVKNVKRISKASKFLNSLVNKNNI
jgi:hypothetical protein